MVMTKKGRQFFPGKIGVTPLGAAPGERPHIFFWTGPCLH